MEREARSSDMSEGDGPLACPLRHPLWPLDQMGSIKPMKTIIQMSEAEEAKALPLLLRHSPGTVLPNRVYVISEEAVKKLREAGVQFTELSRESNAPRLEGVGSGERI